jgi:RimJ/RimL family protein N-acetyltransferase
METPILFGERIYLRRLTEDDVSEEYVKWMNDPDINQYLESRFNVQTIDSTKAFIRSVTNEKNYQFGIFVKGTSRHIGNIKIGNINPYHKYADVGFLIGEKDFWGKGIATEAIKLITDYAFTVLGLHKLWGGAYAPNVGSQKAFLKNGYQIEGCKKSHCMCDGKYVDSFIFGIVNEK